MDTKTGLAKNCGRYITPFSPSVSLKSLYHYLINIFFANGQIYFYLHVRICNNKGTCLQRHMRYLRSSCMGNDKKILLTFDVEEFDLPLEHGMNLSTAEQMAVGKQGLDVISEILN